MRFLLSVGVAVVMLAAARAQEPQRPAEQQPPTFRTGTNIVRVDVTVSDRSGRPVTNLTADDFVVTEDGKPQPITSFKLVEATGQPVDDFELAIRSPEHAAAEAAKDEVRVFLIFWDDYHINEFVSTLRAKEQLTRFVLEAFGPTDLVALMDPLTPLDAVRFTRDRRRLADEIHKLKGRRGVYVPPRSVLEEAHLYDSRGVEYIRAQVTASAIKAASAHLGTLREGPKSLIVITETIGQLRDRTDEVMRDLIRTANDANTTIFAVDPRGLQLRQFGGVMDTIAAGSGGDSIISNDIDHALRKVVTRASAFYLLGYSMAEVPMDGKFHNIKVRVKRGGVDISSRSGYWAPRATDVARAKSEAAAAADIPAEVTRALSELTPSASPRPVDYWLGIAPGTEGRCAVTLAWSPRVVKDPTQAAATVQVNATGDTGPLHDGPLEPGGVTFAAPPGRLVVTFTVRNAAGEVVDREQRESEIPDPATVTLALGTPSVLRVRTPLDLREVKAAAVPPVFAGREFTRDERVLVRIDAYGAAADEAVVSARLLGRGGVPLVALPVKPANAPGRYEIDLVLASVARGEFLVEIQALNGTERVQALVPIRVR